RLMDALGSAVRHLGVEVIEGTAVERLIIEKGACLGVRDHAGKTHYAGAVITAAGSWSGELLDTAGLKLPVVPARGQMLALRGPVLPFEHVVHADQCYLVPRRDKRIIVGSTVEYTGFRKEVTARGISTLLSKAISTFPHLAEFEIVETWSGLRPDTSDHLPVLGPSGIDNLFLATGHFRNGILLAPITAEIIRDGIIEERWPTETTSHFGFGRFAALSEAATGDGS
ncbi:MAG TPA: FAD-dependent oxidoreductase, partial [Blastocatellia bacterium]|nr:FAD-dependent oxidoreductase [Blastocatellia bacterium]